MSFANNEETTLFTQLSEEQQEIVSGGDGYDGKDYVGDFGLSKTDFLYKSTDLVTLSASGKDGSIATGHLSKKVLDTSGVNVIAFKH